ncbi:MAG: ABC transporter ATP-binding protein [Sulfobacillus thermosulfidooxidans]|uniref:ABC transporter ATP-binding protein n=1 Tax=Sulfobacillus thermosulfidooxidans TaxID=28034 RepID=A0A2T2WU63_SULTH|nr:MAG: ABC transporter ATP-binding protein [Sulfobacillus thermosulfidooxidans]
MSRKPLMTVTNIAKKFGGFRALDGISLVVEPGEILGLVGPNGSGKTTLINVISGLYYPDHGSIHFQGVDIARLPMHKRAGLGINRTFQIPKPFKSLTVQENVNLAYHYGKNSVMAPDEALEFVNLSQYRDHLASELNSSQQKLLDLARALATGPKLLLIDELAAGLNHQELETVANHLKNLSQQNIALIVVEHHLGFVNQLTERVIVMNAGKEIFQGSLSQAAQDPTVAAVYLGTGT